MITSVTVNNQTTQFVYDGDGNLVKKIKPDNTTTIYIGSIYEKEVGTATKITTYYAGGAMRVDNTLYYVLKDHLGSASVTLDATGTVVAEMRFYPFGESRVISGTTPTDKLFTGQHALDDLGIYNYGARFYSPKLGRFLSADTIVSSFANPQSLNRYSYVLNNPLKYIDPSGHRECDSREDCDDMGSDWGNGGIPGQAVPQYVAEAQACEGGGGFCGDIGAITPVQGPPKPPIYGPPTPPRSCGPCIYEPEDDPNRNSPNRPVIPPSIIHPVTFGQPPIAPRNPGSYIIPDELNPRLPDYHARTFSSGLVSISFIEDRYHKQYISVGPTISIGIPFFFAASDVDGYINNSGFDPTIDNNAHRLLPKPSDIQDFIVGNPVVGNSFNLGIGALYGRSITFTLTGDKSGAEQGLFSPQVGISWMFTKNLP